MASQATARLFRLSESDYTVADSADDVRGRKVVDRNGDETGKVDDLLIDESENKVRFLRVETGGVLGIGAKSFLLPVDAITSIDDAHVHVDATREKMSGSPDYDPDIAHDDYLTDVYGYYGFPAYWAAGYAYPMYPYYR